MNTIATCTSGRPAGTIVQRGKKPDIKAAGRAAASWIARRVAEVAHGGKLVARWTLKCTRTVAHWKSGERIPDSADLLLIGRHCPDTQRRVIAFWTMPEAEMVDPVAYLERDEHVAKIDGLLKRLARGAVDKSKRISSRARAKAGAMQLRFRRNAKEA